MLSFKGMIHVRVKEEHILSLRKRTAFVFGEYYQTVNPHCTHIMGGCGWSGPTVLPWLLDGRHGLSA